jgi:NAD(P)-dependent dehydrogenase (short-subunit alcohol dehydrogenase family)
MQVDLSGRVAVVTGSASGIGFAIAGHLAEAGAEVVVNGVDAAKTAEAAARIGARAVTADISSAQGCAALTAQVPRCDILVNNAGIATHSGFFDTSDDVWERTWSLNVMAGVRLSRAYLQGMRERDWGRVIFIASESAFNIPVEMIHYGVSKTADVALARGLAKEMAGTGVTVNAVLPGPTLSDGAAASFAGEMKATGKSGQAVMTDFIAQHRPSSIIRRPITPDEVANLVLYVASPLSSATTGAALRVDGGVIDSLL